MKLHQLYDLLRSSVVYHPDIRTFCVITEPNDITIDNLKQNIHDKYKPFFYSRDWEDQEYDPSQVQYSTPALFIYEKPFTIKNIFSGKDTIEYNLQFLLVMKDHNYDTPDQVLTDSQRLQTVEIFHRCKLYLINILNYVNEVYSKISSFNKDIPVYQWQSKGMLLAGVSADLVFVESCPPYEKYWDGEIVIIDEPGGSVISTSCKRYIKVVNGVTLVNIPHSEHLVSNVSGANIYDSIGNEVDALVNINTSTNHISVESNINFSNHKIIIH